MLVSPRSRKPLYAIAALVLIAFMVSVIVWANSANKGQIIDRPVIATSQPPYSKFSSKYISFRYSSHYSQHANQARDKDLELFTLTADTNFDKRLAIAVSSVAGGNIQLDSGYILRQSQSGVYTSRQALVGGVTATIFSKHDGLEQTAFIPARDKIAVLSFTTTGNLDNLDPEVSQVLSTFAWK